MDPEVYARALLRRLAVSGPPDVRAIASELSIPVYEKPLERCDGMLVRVKGTAKGVIAIKASISEETRKAFTIAHELGHLFLPGHDDYGICSTDVIESWAKNLRDREREANAFAAELLMPERVVAQLTGRLEPSLSTFELIAEVCRTSLTASGYRFITMTSYAAALVWSQRGTVLWAKRSGEFRHWVRLQEDVDARTFAADLFRGLKVQPGLHSVPAAAWLDLVDPDATLLEESRAMPSYDAVLTVLWAREPLSEPDGTDDILAPLDPEEFTLRRSRWRR